MKERPIARAATAATENRRDVVFGATHFVCMSIWTSTIPTTCAINVVCCWCFIIIVVLSFFIAFRSVIENCLGRMNGEWAYGTCHKLDHYSHATVSEITKWTTTSHTAHTNPASMLPVLKLAGLWMLFSCAKQTNNTNIVTSIKQCMWEEATVQWTHRKREMGC